MIVDRGEALLAVVGFRPILDGSLRRITDAQQRQAREIQRTILTRGRALFAGQLDGEPAPSPIDYDAMLEQFTEPPSVADLTRVIANIPAEDHEDAEALLAAAGRAYQYLQANYPISVQRHLLGASSLPPSTVALTTFEFLLEIVDQPLLVWNMIASGLLLASQARGMRAVYPTLHQAIVDDLALRVTETPGDPPFALALSTLAGAPYADPTVTVGLATAQAQKAAKLQAGRQQPPQKSRVALMTAPPSKTPL